MASFYYKALDAQGASTQGTLEASSRKEALTRLRALGLRPVAIDESALEEPKSTRIPFAGLLGKKSQNKANRSSALPFLKKLLQLHQGGLPIGDALKILAQRLSEPDLKLISSQLFRELSEGQTLALAIKNHSNVFEPSLVFLIEAGEATGNLVPVLQNIVAFMEESAALRRKVLGSLAYPIFVSMIALGVVAIFLFFLLPRIESMLQSLGGELSFSARLLVGTAHFLITGGPFIVGGLIFGTFFIINYRKKPEGRRVTDNYILKIPYLRDLMINADLCRVANLLATLLGSGVNTTEALKLTERSIQNTVLLAEFQAARTQIGEGVAFSTAFRRSRLFPPMGLDILSVGENTGNIVPSLQEIAKVQGQALASQLQFATSFIATAALVFAFSLVVILTLGIVTSILQVSQSIR